MKNASLLLVLLLLLLTGPPAAVAQGYRPAAGATFATDRGQCFTLVLDGQPLTPGPVPQLQVAALAPGQHWAEFGLPGGPRRGGLRFRASVWLEPGLETQFVLYLRPGFAPLLRQEGAVALALPGSCNHDDDHDHGGYGYDDHHDGYGPPQSGPGYGNNGPGNGGNGYGNAYGSNGYQPSYAPMSLPDVAALVQALRRRSFDSSRLDLAKQALSQTAIRADDFREVLRTFDFDASRTELATFAYPYIVDRQNFYRVYDAFDFESNARAVDHRLSGF